MELRALRVLRGEEVFEGSGTFPVGKIKAKAGLYHEVHEVRQDLFLWIRLFFELRALCGEKVFEGSGTFPVGKIKAKVRLYHEVHKVRQILLWELVFFGTS